MLEKIWSIFGTGFGPLMVGKILGEDEDSIVVIGEDNQLYPTRCVGKGYFEKFETIEEAIEYLIGLIGCDEKEVRKLTEKKFPSAFKKGSV